MLEHQIRYMLFGAQHLEWPKWSWVGS